jgi:hypothetical protein
MNMRRDVGMTAALVAMLCLWTGTMHSQDGLSSFKPAPEFYGTGSWNADSLGNHRAVIRVTSGSEAVAAHIPWRRRDLHPELKNVIMIDAATGKRITNIFWTRLDRESGDVVFQPQTVPGEYYVYYLVYRPKGSRNYPKGFYAPMEQTADAAWLKKIGLVTPAPGRSPLDKFERASLVQFQSIDEFNSFYPMEVIATSEEVRSLLKTHSREPFLLFPEDRSHPIKMTGDVPFRWIEQGGKREFSGVAARGEFFSFQVGLFASTSKLENVNVKMTDLRDRKSVV